MSETISMSASPAVSPPLVSIVIPTLNRPMPLARALESAFRQSVTEPFEIIVVDNSVDANAQRQIYELQAQVQRTYPHITLLYRSEPNPGVSTARNAGVAKARGAYVAFLDDDQEATPDWLASHLRAARASDADAVFGPIKAISDDHEEIGIFAILFARHFDLPEAADITDKVSLLGTNNSMFKRAGRLVEDEPFNLELNGCGGEDSLLLRSMVVNGAKLGWAKEAHVLEFVAHRRLNWAYFRKRKFLSGQIRTFVYAMLSPPQWDKVALWMGIGAGQIVVGGLGGLVLGPFDKTRAEKLTAAFYSGLGKVAWMKRFRPGLYGKGLVS